MKILTIVLRVLLGLLMVMPVLGTLGVFPPPTAEMYSDPAGWAFISAMMETGYMMPLIGVTFAVVLVLIILNKMALAAVILAPLTVNIVLFHVFLNVTPVSAESAMGWLLLVLNAYFLWVNRAKYKALW